MAVAGFGIGIGPDALGTATLKLPERERSIITCQFSRESTPDEHVSIIDLLASPTRFDGKKIVLRGYMIFEFENHAICVSRHVRSSKKCLWISIDAGPYESKQDATRYRLKERQWAAFNRQVVTMRGVFDKGETGHFGLWRGGVRDVTEISGHGKRVTFDPPSSGR